MKSLAITLTAILFALKVLGFKMAWLVVFTPAIAYVAIALIIYAFLAWAIVAQRRQFNL